MKGERGFALLAVLLLLLVAAAAAGAAQLAAHADIYQSDALKRQAQLEAAIDGACALVAADLLDQEFAKRAPPLDGSRGINYSIGNVSVGVRLVSEAGLLNVNLADPQDVAAIISAADGSAETARLVANRLGEHRGGGGGAGMTHIVEFGALFPEQRNTFYAVLPFFTTRGQSGIDANAAPEGLRRALPRLGLQPADTPPPTALTVAAFPRLALFLDARLPGGAELMEERIVKLSPEGNLQTLERRPIASQDVVSTLLGRDKAETAH